MEIMEADITKENSDKLLSTILLAVRSQIPAIRTTKHEEVNIGLLRNGITFSVNTCNLSMSYKDSKLINNFSVLSTKSVSGFLKNKTKYSVTISGGKDYTMYNTTLQENQEIIEKIFLLLDSIDDLNRKKASNGFVENIISDISTKIAIDVKRDSKIDDILD